MNELNEQLRDLEGQFFDAEEEMAALEDSLSAGNIDRSAAQAQLADLVRHKEQLELAMESLERQLDARV